MHLLCIYFGFNYWRLFKFVVFLLFYFIACCTKTIRLVPILLSCCLVARFLNNQIDYKSFPFSFSFRVHIRHIDCVLSAKRYAFTLTAIVFCMQCTLANIIRFIIIIIIDHHITKPPQHINVLRALYVCAFSKQI